MWPGKIDSPIYDLIPLSQNVLNLRSKFHNGQSDKKSETQAKVIPKSRYDSIDSFLSNCCNKWDGYNDIEVGDDDKEEKYGDNQV